MQVFTLKWEQIQHYSFLAKNEPIEDIAGVYLWGFNSNGKFFYYYAGKARRVKWRLTDHISNILGLNYRLYDRIKFENIPFPRSENDYEALDYKIKAQAIIAHMENGKYQKLIEFMINNFYFTYAPIQDYQEYAADAEKKVIHDLDMTSRGNTRGGKSSPVIELGNIFEVIADFNPVQF
jgi:hypothetical protein